MATFQNFRSAFNGFNREDVVHYIEYINNKHASQVNQLKTDLQNLQAELAEKEAAPKFDPEMAAQLDAAVAAKVAAESEAEALRAELAKLREQLASTPAVVAPAAPTFDELEAYRRAERAERIAGERVTQLYQQANGALAEAAVRADEASGHITEIAERIASQVAELKTALCQSKTAMKNATATLYSICPLSNEE